MTQPNLSIESLLQRREHEIQTADGRIARLCRDERGHYWVIDATERVMSLSEFASDIAPQARRLCERERAGAMREIATSVKRAVARAVQAFRPAPKPAHA